MLQSYESGSLANRTHLVHFVPETQIENYIIQTEPVTGIKKTNIQTKPNQTKQNKTTEWPTRNMLFTPETFPNAKLSEPRMFIMISK